MKAVGYQKSLPIADDRSLVDTELPKPAPAGRDLLVEVQAVSVNPVDTKMRMRAQPPAGEWRVLGWDAAGVVEAAGPDAKLFKAGDAVFYAGTIDRQGTNAEYHLVDERIVGPKPTVVIQCRGGCAAADRHHGMGDAVRSAGREAGRAGCQRTRSSSSAVPAASARSPSSLRRALTGSDGHRHGLASGDEGMGETARRASRRGSRQAAGGGSRDARHRRAGFRVLHHADGPPFRSDRRAIAPQGRFGLIDDPDLIDMRKLKRKSASLHWELMFTRSMFETADMLEQDKLLTEVSRLVDAGKISTTLARRVSARSTPPISGAPTR